MAKRILIVDDSALMRRQIRQILEAQTDVEVCAEAMDGVEAVQKVAECHPDLVVLDILMPQMNGFEATRKIKILAPKLPILLFTLEKTPQVVEESRRAGADAVLPKAQGSMHLSPVVLRLLHSAES